jgi:nucleoside-diphosphate-sugar epimerase
MKLNILVTGGAGYIGSIMVPELLAAGHAVTVLDNFLYGQNSLAHVCSNPDLSIVRADCRVESVVKGLMSKADVIIPLAALVGAPICARDPVSATTINHDAILMLFKLAGDNQMILMPTTNSAYGSGGKGNHCDEESPLNPISQYAVEKVKIEEKLMEKAGAVSFRLATVFGMSPRMRIDLLVNDFTHRAVTDRFVVLFEGHFKRNYIHIRDVSRVFLHALANLDRMKGQIYNVGLSDANVSKRELCECIQKQVPDFVFVESEIGKDPDQRDYIVSNAKIEATGFKPAYSLNDGIRELIKGYAMIRNTRYGNV